MTFSSLGKFSWKNLALHTCGSSTCLSSTGSPATRLVDRELPWRDRGMSEDTRVYTSMLVRHNIVPEQVLFETGCSDYQDERAFPVLAQAAENLMRVGSDSTDDDADQ